MAIIYAPIRKSKPKKKPGWKKDAQEYSAWEARISSMSSGITGVRTLKTIPAAPKQVQPATSSILPAKYVIGSGTKAVPRPEFQYRDNPEMLERELKARAVKHNAVPMYNKGGDGYVSQEMLQELLSTNKRRS